MSRKPSLFRPLLAAALLVSANTWGEDLYLGEYILLEKTDSGYEVGDQKVSSEALDTLPSLLKQYSSKAVLLGKESQITVGELLTLGPILAEAGYKMFYLDNQGEPAQVLSVSAQ